MITPAEMLRSGLGSNELLDLNFPESDMTTKTFFIVWNEQKNEGFVTDDKGDALYVSKGREPRGGTPAVGEAFRDAYDKGGDLPMQEVGIEV